MDTETRSRASGTGTQVLDSPTPEGRSAPNEIAPSPASLTATVPYVLPVPEGPPTIGPAEVPAGIPGRVITPILAGAILVLIAGAAVFLLSNWLADVSARQQAAHSGVSSTLTFVRAVSAEGADSAQVNLSMERGSLAVSGGARELLETRITSNVVDWHPQINYDVRPTRFDVQHNTGMLTIEQPPVSMIATGAVRNDWDLRFNNSLPMEFTADLGAVDSNLQLGHLNLTRLEVTGGTGSTVIDLTGLGPRDMHVRLYGRAGEMRLVLPPAIGVQVTTAGGPGQLQTPGWQVSGGIYTNAGYGQGPTLWIYAKLDKANIVLAQAP